MKLTLEALEAIDAIARKGSYAAAAEELHKVPSAISYTVQKLEADLGVTVFDRSGHRARLTRTGELLLRHGRELLRSAAELECRAARIDAGWETELRIAVGAIVPFSALVPYMTAFYGESTATRLRIFREPFGGEWDALVGGRADLIIGATGQPPAGAFAHRIVSTVDSVFCVSPAHPLATVQEPLSATQIAPYRVVTLSDTTRVAELQFDALPERQESVSVPDLDASLQLQIATLGCGLLPACVARKHLEHGTLLEKKLALAPAPQSFYLGWRPDDAGEALKWWLNQLDRPGLIAEMWWQ